MRKRLPTVPVPELIRRIPRRRGGRISLAAACTGAGVVWLAFSDLAVALPQIADEFAADLGTLQWANNAFGLVAGALVITARKIADIVDRRLMLQVGTLLLAVFSLLAALSPGVEWLIVARGLMGVGAALILPASLALIPPGFARRAEVTVFGIWQAVAWGGLAAGPAIGGVISDALGWRWLFWINLSLAFVAFAAVRVTTPESREAGISRRIDWAGLGLIGCTAFALLAALTDGPSAGWDSPVVIGLFVAAIVLAVVGYQIERRVREPLVDLRLFRYWPFSGAVAANLTMNLTFLGVSFLLVLALENVLGHTAVQAGLLMLPAMLGVFLGIPLGGRLGVRWGAARPPVLVGLVIAAAGLFVLGFSGALPPAGLIAVALVMLGFGVGLVTTPVANATSGEVPPDLAVTAAGVLTTSSMLGGALGVATLTAFARGLTSHETSSAIQASGLGPAEVAEVRQALVSSSSFDHAIASLPDDIEAAIVQMGRQAFSSAVADTMVASAILTLAVTMVVSWLWPRRSRRTGAG